MKAICTKYHAASNSRGARICAFTGTKGQRLFLKIPVEMPDNQLHAWAARKLCERMKWSTDLIGGGFPDNSMVWVFANSPDRTLRQFTVEIIARNRGALGVCSEIRTYTLAALDHADARTKAIERGHKEGLELVAVNHAKEIERW